jgi:hypothetical protein
MFHRIAKLLCIVATLAISGLPTGLAQCHAWATMIEQRIEQSTLAAAVESTFDGEHPCPRCLAVKKASDEQRKHEKQGTAPSEAKPVRAVGVQGAFVFISMPRPLIGILSTEIQSSTRPGFAMELLRPPAVA